MKGQLAIPQCTQNNVQMTSIFESLLTKLCQSMMNAGLYPFNIAVRLQYKQTTARRGIAGGF
jgi:hypothetical protein